MKLKRNFVAIMISITLAIFFACAGFSSQTQKLNKPEKSKKLTVVTAKADHTKSIWNDKKTVLMKGNVSFTHEDTIIKSDQVDYDDSQKMAVSPGKLTIQDPECDIVGDKGCAYFKKHIGIVEGNVLMNVKKNESEQNTDKESIRTKFNQPTTITCQKLEYCYKTKIASATGNVLFKQKNRSASAEKAVYDEKKELLTLSGNVKGIDEDGQTFSAPGDVVISLKKGDEWMEAPNSSATFKIDIDEDENK